MVYKGEFRCLFTLFAFIGVIKFATVFIPMICKKIRKH